MSRARARRSRRARRCGCIGGGFDLADLPGGAVAFVYRTREESERCVELRRRAKEADLKRAKNERYDSSSVRLDGAAELGGMGRAEQKAADLLGACRCSTPGPRR